MEVRFQGGPPIVSLLMEVWQMSESIVHSYPISKPMMVNHLERAGSCGGFRGMVRKFCRL